MAIFLDVKLNELQKKNKFLDENGNEIKVVYRLSENKQTATLYDFYYEGSEYLDTDLIVPLSWTDTGETQTWNRGTWFRNVKCSSKDKEKPRGFSKKSWLKFYEAKVNNFQLVTRSYEFDWVVPDGGITQKGGYCNSSFCIHCKNQKNIIGGHVYLGHEEQDHPEKVAILPICKNHNTRSDNGKGPGLGFYMVLDVACNVPIIKWKIEKDVFEERLLAFEKHDEIGKECMEYEKVENEDTEKVYVIELD